MNGKAILSIVLATTWQAAQAEPVFMPQAQSVMQAKTRRSWCRGSIWLSSL